jgi:hypothetical protein
MSNLTVPPVPAETLVRGIAVSRLADDECARDNCGVRVVLRVEEERRMSSTIEESISRDSLLEMEYDVARRDAERAELAREIAAQHERLHTLRATVLEELTKQRRITLPRWPSGPKFVTTLVNEDEWWEKMLGRKRAA